LFANESERFRHNKTPELLTSASPVTYVSKDDPPLLVFHGDKDQVVPLSQSKHLHTRYQEADLESSFHVIEGAAHGGLQFSDSERYGLVQEFFARHIKRVGADGI
jgi:dipeptidyl aminopeptidase/acylaminoacyl peptidase